MARRRRGWILNEIFRRVEPQGRTLGEYLAEEIAPKLGGGLTIGLPPEAKVQAVSSPSQFAVLAGSLTPKALSHSIDAKFSDMVAFVMQVKRMLAADEEQQEGKAKRYPMPVATLSGAEIPMPRLGAEMTTKQLMAGESPSANGVCTARGLAKLGRKSLPDFSIDHWFAYRGVRCQWRRVEWSEALRRGDGVPLAVRLHQPHGQRLCRSQERLQQGRRGSISVRKCGGTQSGHHALCYAEAKRTMARSLASVSPAERASWAGWASAAPSSCGIPNYVSAWPSCPPDFAGQRNRLTD